MSERPYLGVGMKFPPQINPATGRIVTSPEEQSVKESVYLILMTHKSERLTRPDFGSEINEYVFLDVGVTRINILIRELTETILSQEPRVSDVRIDVEDQTREGRFIINIDYMVSATHTRDSLVFPYYLENDDIMPEEEVYGDYDFEDSEEAVDEADSE